MAYKLDSITTDGHKATLKASRAVMPKVLIQRCLVHIQRICLLWLTANSTSEASKELRALAVHIHLIKTQNDKSILLIN